MVGEEFFHHLPMIKNIIIFASEKKSLQKLKMTSPLGALGAGSSWLQWSRKEEGPPLTPQKSNIDTNKKGRSSKESPLPIHHFGYPLSIVSFRGCSKWFVK